MTRKLRTYVNLALSAAAVAGGLLAAPLALAHALPLGDGKLSTAPKAGYVYSCQTSFSANGVGAQASGDWLDAANGTWDPDLKPVVDGSVNWPSEIAVSVEGDSRVIRANGLPDHPTGVYPVAKTDDAYNYDRNPNSIQSSDVLLTLAAMPAAAARPSCVPMGMIGFTLSGAKIFNAFDAKGDDAPAHEIQDKCNGHPEMTGEYHYHNLSPCLNDTRSGPDGASDLLGYALDGFGIYGPYGAGGKELHTSDLDECHGTVSKVMWDGKAVEMYHYVFTEDYPYTIGCFAGTPVSVSTARSGGSQAQQQQQPQPRNRQNPPPKRK